MRRFLHARSTREIVFVRGTTEAINLAANSWGRGHLEPGDEIKRGLEIARVTSKEAELL